MVNGPGHTKRCKDCLEKLRCISNGRVINYGVCFSTIIKDYKKKEADMTIRH